MTLEAQTVSRRFAGLDALVDVSLALESGEILGLIGPNGSGKTTLLNALSGVVPPSSGRILVDGVEVTRWPRYQIARAGIGRTFQTVRLFGRLSVLENVQAAIVSRGRRRSADPLEDAAGLLRTFHLGDVLDRPAATLAYGDQRRLEIARAVAAGPRYLLLDEPAAGMNEAESDGLLQDLRSVRDALGIGLLLVEHDLRLIMRLCERIQVLNSGRTIAVGSPEEVRRDPAVVAAYLGPSSD
jgi:ABC-type branched-subunit amino acid transport system ATPase component